MKNKKGVSIGRIILYFLFLSLIALFIYTLFITFKAMKKKEPLSTNSQVNSSLRMVYNNSFEYSGADYLSNCYINICNCPDITYNYLVGNFTTPINTKQLINSTSSFPLNVYTSFVDTGTTYDPSYSSLDFYYKNCVNYTTDNSFNLGQLVKDFYTYCSEIELNNPYDVIDFLDLWNNNNSAVLVIECNIPYSLFDFSWVNYSNVSNSTSNLWVTCNNSSRLHSLTGVASDRTINQSSLPSSTSVGDHITSIIIPLFQSYTGNGLGYYILGGNLNYRYNNALNSTALSSLNLDFVVHTHDESYQSGYDDGYQNGLNTANNANATYTNDLVSQVNILQTTVNSLNDRINQQTLIINNLNAQLQNSQNNFKGLFFTMADVPFKTVSNALGFEFWGVNLFKFFVGIITALGILWLIKKII